MNNLPAMIWIELRKVVRSKMLLLTILGSILMPMGIAFLIFVSKNPDLARKIGLISAKANLMTSAATTWPAYLNLFTQGIASAGFILFVLIISWVFGREFTDGTVKDILAVPVLRTNIVLAKFIVVTLWSYLLLIVIFILGLVMGALIGLPQGTPAVIAQGSWLIVLTSTLVLLTVLPVALFAGIGRGYLLPIGVAVVLLVTANVVAVAGWGDFFPWAIPVLYATAVAKGTPFNSISIWIVLFTALAGILATNLWWKYSDQNR